MHSLIPKLESPGRGVAENGSTGKSDRSIPFRDQEALFRMDVSAGTYMMVVAQRRFYLTQCFSPLHLRLTLPKEYKSLATNAAICFNGGVGSLA